MPFRKATRNQVFWIFIVMALFTVFWSGTGREPILKFFSGGIYLRLLFYFGFQYGLLIYLYWIEVLDFKKLLGFMLAVVYLDLVTGLPFVYQMNGLSTQTLGQGTEFSDDAIIGMQLEKSLYNCSSLEKTCSLDQTKTVFSVINRWIPLIILIFIFELFTPEGFISSFRRAL